MKTKKRTKPVVNFRTDLAIEAKEAISVDGNEDIDGVSIDTEEEDGIEITHVKILNKKGSLSLGKPIGNYITIEAEAMKENDIDTHEKIIKITASKIAMLTKLKEDSVILVVGLGNWNVTPDALGPKTISKVLVTRHLSAEIPLQIDKSVRKVAAVTPGVMGITGIETFEMIEGIVNKIKPDILIAIDALAARKLSRINAAIQMSDSGITPGAGVGNKRAEISMETLGIPVISIGVPTVVDAATLVNDTMDKMLGDMIKASENGKDFYKMLKELADEEKYKLIYELLAPYKGNMVVTPKEVDAVIDRLSYIIANSINIAMHPGITMEDINRYTH
ncbi:MAG: GPR endopeptidase [Lachnospiraceae bacterium]|nr:GPR endopeptidase [Lachnospiraceae bacterium]